MKEVDLMVIITHTLPAKETYENSTIHFPQNISQELFANLQQEGRLKPTKCEKQAEYMCCIHSLH